MVNYPSGSIDFEINGIRLAMAILYSNIVDRNIRFVRNMKSCKCDILDSIEFTFSDNRFEILRKMFPNEPKIVLYALCFEIISTSEDMLTIKLLSNGKYYLCSYHDKHCSLSSINNYSKDLVLMENKSACKDLYFKLDGRFKEGVDLIMNVINS
jgi:hypothetical protein